MVLQNFYINILIRVVLIVVCSVVLGIVIRHVQLGYYYTLAGMIMLIALQCLMLFNRVNRTNSDLEKFFSSVHDHDSSIRFPGTKNDSFKKLHDSMNALNAMIQQEKTENRRTGHFLQSMVDHVDIGLLSFDTHGRIEICNKSAEKYIAVRQPRQLSALKDRNPELYGILNDIKPGKEVLYKDNKGNSMQNILVKATQLKFESNVITLVSFQDITRELEKKELDSWQKLIRVLTHEIMNSISPITSLSAVISGYFKKDSNKLVSPEEIDSQTIRKTLSGLDTIEETSKGLLGFVGHYRSFAFLPVPDPITFTISNLFSRCIILMEPGMPKNIRLETDVRPGDIALVADFAQIEQVLINLVRNAIAAIPDDKEGVIRLMAYHHEESVILQVGDNGTGIPGDILEDIFVPFFTTLKNGSGIGLSLSKQIMQNHQGTISVNSVQDEGSVFMLKFPMRAVHG